MRVSGTSAGSHIHREFEKDVVDDFLPAIRHLAYRIAKRSEHENILDDLVTAGIIGLLETIEKYDPSRGVKLNTFAYMRIRGAMIDELRSRDWFPRRTRGKSKKINEVTRKLEHRMGRRPEEKEVAQEMNMDLDSYLSMFRSCHNLSIVSIEDRNDPVEESRDNVISYVLDDNENPEKHAESEELKKILAEELEKLSEKHRMVLTRYYHQDMNMREIGVLLGLTEARVSQLHAQAIANLRPLVSRYFENE